MTREAFIEKWQYEMVGLLMASFGEAFVANKPNHDRDSNARVGREVIQQMKRAKQLLGEMWDSMNKQEPKKGS